ncbi:MAG: SpoIIIAH-like family protein [Tissierellia bacterium]|jgi:stage III sporulation protein AH|nr:SpoIIIAH-like family protein [Tissierellia bacterium]
MFKIKRPAIIGLLLVLLIFTGYLNYQLTQEAVLKASGDYQEYEELEMANFTSNNFDISEKETESQESSKEIAIIDSKTDENISEVISANNNDFSNSLASESTSNIDFFVEYRLSRDKLRANNVDRLDNIIQNVQTTEDVRRKAQEEIIEIGNISEKELQIEGLVKSKGFDDALVFITDKDVKVVVGTDELTEQDMVKILDIVKVETSFETENIKIMKKQ